MARRKSIKTIETPEEWLARHSNILVYCPIGPSGVLIHPHSCALRQRVMKSTCICSSPPVPPAERNGVLQIDEDFYKLKGRRGHLATVQGKKVADEMNGVDVDSSLRRKSSR